MQSTSTSQSFRSTLSLACPSPGTLGRSHLDLARTNPRLVSAADFFLSVTQTRKHSSTPASQVAADVISTPVPHHSTSTRVNLVSLGLTRRPVFFPPALPGHLFHCPQRLSVDCLSFPRRACPEPSDERLGLDRRRRTQLRDTRATGVVRELAIGAPRARRRHG